MQKGKAYDNLGNACDSLGDYKKAIEFHQQSLSTAKEIGTLAVRITISAIVKKQSNFISSLLVSQKG